MPGSGLTCENTSEHKSVNAWSFFLSYSPNLADSRSLVRNAFVITATLPKRFSNSIHSSINSFSRSL